VCDLTFPVGIHSSKKGKAAAQRAQREGKGFGWQKKKSSDKAKRFKKWKSVTDTRQFSRWAVSLDATARHSTLRHNDSALLFSKHHSFTGEECNLFM